MANPSIAIIGLEGSGKTVLMTVLAKKLSMSQEAGCYLDPIGIQTLMRVEDTWAALQQGEWPPSTPPGEMFSLNWKMYIQRNDQQTEADIRLIDIAGQDTRQLFSTDNMLSETPEHLKPLAEYISNASLVLFALNIKDYIAETDTRRRIENQAVLKSALDQLNGSKKILLVFTQYDQYEAFVNKNGGLDAFCQKYLPYVYNAYISTKKRVFGTEQIPMMSVAAVNDTQVKILDGTANRVPVPDFSSRGLDELCKWIVDGIYLAEVLYQQGEAYYEAEDWSKAVKCYSKAAEMDHAEAQYSLGICYDNGEGVPQNHTEAVKWYRKAAEQGLAKAQYCLGVAYADGEGVPQNDTKAFRWYRKAAKQGLAAAQYCLGDCYYTGIGVDEDEDEAFKWYRKAAEQGFAEAQCQLGHCYDEGSGVEEDKYEAFQWYRKAATQGFAEAQYCLGMCYIYGESVEEDEDKAVKWLRKAAKQGYEDAEEKLDELGY